MSSPVLGVDPGKRGCGVALFSEGWLKEAAYVPAEEDEPPWSAVSAVLAWASKHVDVSAPGEGAAVVVERMKVYAGRRGNADPSDLLELEAVAGGVLCVFAACGWLPVGVLAREWNGQIPRDVRMQRTRSWISSRGRQEVTRVLPCKPPALVHNAWSAIGIARWYLDHTR
jgi:hypothetical protein